MAQVITKLNNFLYVINLDNMKDLKSCRLFLKICLFFCVITVYSCTSTNKNSQTLNVFEYKNIPYYKNFPKEYLNGYTAYEPFTPHCSLLEGLNSAKKLNKPVLLMFTLYNGLSEKDFEWEFIRANKNQMIITDEYVFVCLILDDYRVINIENNKDKTIGEINSGLLKDIFKSNRPLYAILDKRGNVLMEPIFLPQNSTTFNHFLKQGLFW